MTPTEVELMTDTQPIREWQSDLSRDEGVAAFLIGFIAFGMFVNLVAFAAVTTRHHVPSRYTALFTCAPWLGLALALTWQTCTASFITWWNWRWILASGDQRIYDLQWIIPGWTAISLALVAGFLINWKIVESKKRVRFSNA